MATIKARKQANGSTRYTAIVRIRSGTTVVHRESRTFTHRTAALSWAKHREVALEDPAELTRLQVVTPTLAELIRWYIDTFETISRWQRSKQTHLEFLERHPLAKTIAHTLTSADLIRHVQARRAAGTGPATVMNDLIWIGVVLRAAKSVRDLLNELKRYTNLKPENLRDIAPAAARNARASSRKSSRRAANQPSDAAHQSVQRDLWH